MWRHSRYSLTTALPVNRHEKVAIEKIESIIRGTANLRPVGDHAKIRDLEVSVRIYQIKQAVVNTALSFLLERRRMFACKFGANHRIGCHSP
jgi:hypothetical protein